MKNNKLLLVIFFSLSCFLVSMNKTYASSEIIKTETKDKVMFISSSNNKFLYSWSFNKDEYNDDYFDLGIKFYTINEDRINNLIDKNMKKQFVSFNYHGTLPSTATIKIPAINFKDGDRLNLYYYDDKKAKIKKIRDNILVMNGYVSFDIDHCSDYFLTMSVVKEAEGENNNGVIIIGMITVLIGLVGYTLFKGKK